MGTPTLMLDREKLRQQYRSAEPFPFIMIERFLDPEFAQEVARSYPPFDVAAEQGKSFKAVNEKRKVQITDARVFPPPVAHLHSALAESGFLSDLSYITGIRDLLADPELVGGGMHITGPGGRLDVHVDFNYLKNRKLYRRLNLLIYLNPVWDQHWGGDIQLWDKDVMSCRQAFVPMINRCVIFETSEISFHGVTPVSPSAGAPRISFAAYYYTREPAANWSGAVHSTVFQARPEERFRRYVLMPGEKALRQLRGGVGELKRRAKQLLQPTS